MKKQAAHFIKFGVLVLIMPLSLIDIAVAQVTCPDANDFPVTINIDYPTVATLNQAIATNPNTKVQSINPASGVANCIYPNNQNIKAYTGLKIALPAEVPSSLINPNGGKPYLFTLTPSIIPTYYTLDDEYTHIFPGISNLFTQETTTPPQYIISGGYFFLQNAAATFTNPSITIRRTGFQTGCIPSPSDSFTYTLSSIDLMNYCYYKYDTQFVSTVTPTCSGSGNSYTCSFCCNHP